MAEAGGMKGRPPGSFWWMKRAVGLEGDLGKKCGHRKTVPSYRNWENGEFCMVRLAKWRSLKSWTWRVSHQYSEFNPPLLHTQGISLIIFSFPVRVESFPWPYLYFLDQLLAVRWWVPCGGGRNTSTGDSRGSNLGGSCATDGGELQWGCRWLPGQAAPPQGDKTQGGDGVPRRCSRGTWLSALGVTVAVPGGCWTGRSCWSVPTLVILRPRKGRGCELSTVIGFLFSVSVLLSLETPLQGSDSSYYPADQDKGYILGQGVGILLWPCSRAGVLPLSFSIRGSICICLYTY